MTKWNLEDLKLIHRHEYERVCDENRELKESQESFRGRRCCWKRIN